MKIDFTFTYIKFAKPIYHKLYGIIEFPLEFHAYLKPSSIGQFSGYILHDGEKWKLVCELQENSTKVS